MGMLIASTPTNCVIPYRGNNIREKMVHELKYDDVNQLNQCIENEYDDFVRDAPPGWTRDGFLSNNVPITIAVRYGQNQAICREPHEEKEHWHRLHNYRNIRTLTVALATHLQQVDSCLLLAYLSLKFSSQMCPCKGVDGTTTSRNKSTR